METLTLESLPKAFTQLSNEVSEIKKAPPREKYRKNVRNQ